VKEPCSIFFRILLVRPENDISLQPNVPRG
jgi:hypothetical protein